MFTSRLPTPCMDSRKSKNPYGNRGASLKTVGISGAVLVALAAVSVVGEAFLNHTSAVTYIKENVVAVSSSNDIGHQRTFANPRSGGKSFYEITSMTFGDGEKCIRAFISGESSLFASPVKLCKPWSPK